MFSPNVSPAIGSHGIHVRRSLGGAALLVAVMGATGCGGGSGSQARTSLSPADFNDPAKPAAAPAPSADTADRLAATPRMVTYSGPVSERKGDFDVVASPGEPVPAATARALDLKPVLVNAKIGDINGRPVFVTDFFQSMDARMRKEAQTAKSQADFEKFAFTEIFRKLQGIVHDELLQAEALASLTPEEKAGFRYFIKTLESNFLSENQASRTLAEESLAESTEKGSIEKWTKDREERELVLYQYRQQILKNVYVPFIEIERYYDRRYDEFNPAPKRQFRVITLDKTDTAAIEAIRSDLTSGVPFAEVAARPVNLFRAKDGGLYVPETPAPPSASAIATAAKTADAPPAAPKYFAIKALNDAAISLAPGAWTGPVDTGSTVAFLQSEEITLPSTSLYDAQDAISQKIRATKVDERMQKYIGDLQKRASVDDLVKMRERLFFAAMERYWLPLHPPK